MYINIILDLFKNMGVTELYKLKLDITLKFKYHILKLFQQDRTPSKKTKIYELFTSSYVIYFITSNEFTYIRSWSVIEA